QLLRRVEPRVATAVRPRCEAQRPRSRPSQADGDLVLRLRDRRWQDLVQGGAQGGSLDGSLLKLGSGGRYAVAPAGSGVQAELRDHIEVAVMRRQSDPVSVSIASSGVEAASSRQAALKASRKRSLRRSGSVNTWSRSRNAAGSASDP